MPAYTAIVRGKDNSNGIGVVEAYDLDTSDQLEAGEHLDPWIRAKCGQCLDRGNHCARRGTAIRNRARDWSVAEQSPANSWIPPSELRDGNGGLIRANDNWRNGGQEAEIIASTVPPGNDLESAIVATLPAGGASYTAIVRGVGDTTGIAVVEVYALQ